MLSRATDPEPAAVPEEGPAESRPPLDRLSVGQAGKGAGRVGAVGGRAPRAGDARWDAAESQLRSFLQAGQVVWLLSQRTMQRRW